MPPQNSLGLGRLRRLLAGAEWRTIGRETRTVRSIYLPFLLPLCAIGPAAAALGTILSGGTRTSLAGTYTLSTGTALIGAAVEYVLALGAVWVLALAIDRFATGFGGRSNPIQSLKLAAYGTTPYWLAGIFAVIPKLAPLGLIVGLYSVRLYALGLPLLMEVPAEKAAATALSVGAVAVILVLAISAVGLLLAS